MPLQHDLVVEGKELRLEALVGVADIVNSSLVFPIPLLLMCLLKCLPTYRFPRVFPPLLSLYLCLVCLLSLKSFTGFCFNLVIVVLLN
jgi:hypothetical protein